MNHALFMTNTDITRKTETFTSGRGDEYDLVTWGILDSKLRAWFFYSVRYDMVENDVIVQTVEAADNTRTNGKRSRRAAIEEARSLNRFI